MKLRMGSTEEVGMSAEKLKIAEEYVASWVHSGETSASILLVARKGVIVTHKAFGKFSGEQDAPDLTEDTLFPLGSVTKPITATAVMILHERGKIDIHDPVQQYIPEFVGEGKEEVKIHHLMSHSSGIHGDVVRKFSKAKKAKGCIIPDAEITQHQQLHEWLYLGYDAPLWKKPDVEMSYCGYGIELLSEIIRRVSGQSIQDFAQANIFEPLGMKNTFYIVPPSYSDKVIRRNKNMEGGDWFNSREALEEPSGGGGAYSTPSDMSIFCQMYLNKGTYHHKRILKPETVAEMTKNQTPGLPSQLGDEYFSESSWGYCWDVAGNKYTGLDIRSPQTFTHSGYGGEFIMVDPVNETVLICFFVQRQKPFFDLSAVVTKVLRAI